MSGDVTLHRTALAPLLEPAGTAKRGLFGWVLLNFAVLVAYSVAGLVVVLFGIGPAKISPIYPPSGIAVAAAFIFGPRILPAIFLGQFCNGFPLLAADQVTLATYVLANGGTGLGAVVEAVLSVAILRGLAGTANPFNRARDVVIFLLGSCLAAAVIGGVIGTISLWGFGFVPDDEFEATLITFILADAAGIAVFGALILAWYRQPKLDWRVAADALVIVAAVAAIAGLEVWLRYPIDYLFLPLLLFAGFRSGPRGVTLAAAAITIAAIHATIARVGPFVGKTDAESILLLEVFMAVITFTGLLLVAVRAQQLEAEAALQAYNLTLEQRVAERTVEVAEKIACSKKNRPASTTI